VTGQAAALPILIISLSRSGGKLVRLLLDGHPQIRALPFEHWQSRVKLKLRTEIFTRFSTLDAHEKVEACGGAHALRKIQRVSGADVATATMSSWLRAAETATSPPDIFAALADSYFAQIGNTGPGKATVNHSGSLCLHTRDQIDMLFGPARHVLTIRDPRAVWTSEHARRVQRYTADRAQRGFVTQAELATHLERSARDADGGSPYLRALCDEYRSMLDVHATRADVIVIRFEHLVQSPERHMRRLAARLGIAWDPRLIEPTQLGQPRRANSSFERTTGIDASAAEGWISRIMSADRDFIERTLGDCVEFSDRGWTSDVFAAAEAGH
jgi:hypothetical protein